MQTFRLVSFTAGLLAASTVALAKANSTPAPDKNYTIVGSSPGLAIPAPGLIAAAVNEISAAMTAHGFRYTADAAQAATVVQVRFLKQGYEIGYNEFIPGSRYSWGFVDSHPLPDDFNWNARTPSYGELKAAEVVRR